MDIFNERCFAGYQPGEQFVFHRSSGRGVKMYIEIRPTLMFASGILRLLFILCAVTHWAACAWFCGLAGSVDLRGSRCPLLRGSLDNKSQLWLVAALLGLGSLVFCG